ncbi:MAG: DUF2946 family protein [Burkholderiales bacterium]
MDPSVLQAMARWPKVPAVWGWLALDRRGNRLLRDFAGDGFGRVDHYGRATRARATFVDEEGSVLIHGERGLGLLDDRDLALFAARLGAHRRSLPGEASREVAARFGFVSRPSDSLR